MAVDVAVSRFCRQKQDCHQAYDYGSAASTFFAVAPDAVPATLVLLGFRMAIDVAKFN